MNKLILLLLTIPLLQSNAFAGEVYSQRGYSSEQRCYRTEYREEYIPGTYDRPGYIKTFHDKVEVPCSAGPVYAPRRTSCGRGSILGGIAGAGVAYGISKPDARGWSIPLGVVTGAIVGCRVDRY